LWDFYERSSIKVKYISVAHQWANGQVERANSLILDGLKKRLYDKNIKKDEKWINEISLVVWGLRTQPSKATGQSPFFLVYGPEAILPADMMWKSPQLEMFEEGEADTARYLESIQLKKSNATSCSSQPATYKESVVTTTGTFKDTLSMLEILFFDESRMISRYTSLTHDGKSLSSYTRLQALDLITYSTLMARRFLILGMSSIYAIFILDHLGHLILVPGDYYFQYSSILLVSD
jgi:hypothetical protein